MTSGLNELMDRLNKIFSQDFVHQYNTSKDTQLKSRIIKQIIENKRNLPQSKPQKIVPDWDRLRLMFHGSFSFKVTQKAKFRLLTGIYPYQSDSIQFSVSSLELGYTSSRFKLQIVNTLSKRKPRPQNESHILKIPLVKSRKIKPLICNKRFSWRSS